MKGRNVMMMQLQTYAELSLVTEPSPSEDESLALYLREIGAVPLLSAEEERSLAVRVREGDEAARAQFVCANMRLVVYLAKRYHRGDTDLPDLIQDGNLGLLRAVEHFDPLRGTRFSTYATWWILQAMQRGREHTARLIRLPYYLDQRLGRIARARARLFEQLGNEPTTAQVAATLGMTVETVEQALVADAPMLSLDRPVSGHHETITLADVLADERPALLDEELCHEEETASQRREIATLLACLSERERQVVALSFGLDSQTGGPRSMAEVGRTLGISRERVRQLSHRAMGKLRCHGQQLQGPSKELPHEPGPERL